MLSHPVRQAILPVITQLGGKGGSVSSKDALFYPVTRVFAVGQNYAAHAKEMGSKVQRTVHNGDVPNAFFFMKPQSSIVTPAIPSSLLSPEMKANSAVQYLNIADASAGAEVPDSVFQYPLNGRCAIKYPTMTESYHHEVELVVAIGAPEGSSDSGDGFVNIPVEDAARYIYAYGIGLDMTRRDLQAIAKQNQRPWDLAKGAEQCTVMSALVSAAALREYATAHPEIKRVFEPSAAAHEAIVAYKRMLEESTVKSSEGDAANYKSYFFTADNTIIKQGAIRLSVNDSQRQDGDLADMMCNICEMIALLSRAMTLRPGDLVFTGTPSGVGAVRRGDRIAASIESLGSLTTDVVG